MKISLMNGADSSNDMNYSSSDSDAAKDTSESKAITAASPVFNKMFSLSASSGKTSSKNSSPWLSKSNGVALAKKSEASKCKKNKKYRRVRTYSTSDSDSDTDTRTSETSLSGGQRSEGGSPNQSEQWSQKLTIMFPASNPLQIRAAIAAATRTGSLNAAVDYLMKGKRKREDDEASLLPSEVKSKPYKRIRMMSADSQDEEEEEPRVSCDVSSDLEHKENNCPSKTTTASVEFLQGAFPSLPRQRLLQVLGDCEGNTDQAVVVLSSDVKETDTTAEKRTKAQSSSAHRARSNHGEKHKVQDLSDEEESYTRKAGDDSDDSAEEDHVAGKHDLILSFLEEASLTELLVLPGCSRKKAEALIKLRPFGSWASLMSSLESSKQLSQNLVHGCFETIQLRNVVVQLMKQCEQISEQMELVISRLTGNMQGSKDDEDQITTQPELLNSEFELKPYQLIGMNWLRIMHSQQLNGILADEMGLGKTIQAISFLAHLLEEGEEGPHVIVVPSSTIENWLRELSTWCPALGVVVYYGSLEERRATRQSIMYQGREDFHVLLTTYNIATGSVEDRSLFKKYQFHYAVFDEGHMLKNMSSLRYQNLMKISAERRLLLTGTPLQNNLLELMSLLCFVMPNIFQGKTEPLKKMFSMISKGDNEQGRYEKERIAQAQRIMRPFVFRRLKKDVLTQLPKKVEEVVSCPLLPDQQDLYNSLLHNFSQQVDGPEVSSGVAMFMQLRKAANHPLLLRKHYNDEKLLQMAKALAKEPSHRDREALPELIKEDMAVMNDFDLISLCKQYKKQLGSFELDPSWIKESGKFHQLDSLLKTMQQQDDRVLLFSQFTMMLDIMEVYLKQKDIRYLRLDGSTPVTDRLQLIDEFNRDPGIFVFLLSTRAGGLGINLTAANTIILHDIDFNPYNDKQAEDRCHRLGQKRTVKVIRLISENTVEEGMLRCASAKLRLEQDVTTANDDDDEAQMDVANLLREAIRKLKKPDSSTCTALTTDSAPSSSAS